MPLKKTFEWSKLAWADKYLKLVQNLPDLALSYLLRQEVSVVKIRILVAAFGFSLLLIGAPS